MMAVAPPPRTLTHRDIGLVARPSLDDHGSWVLLNPLTGERAVLPKAATVVFGDEGWGFVVDAAGRRAVRELLPTVVCRAGDGALYAGFAGGAKFLATLEQHSHMIFPPWAAAPCAADHHNVHMRRIACAGQFNFYGPRQFPEI